MRLENHHARFDHGDEGLDHAFSDTAVAEHPPAPPQAPAAEAPSQWLNEQAQRPNAWQGLTLPGSGAPSPMPGVDAETFARIEAMGSRDNSAGGGRGSSFGGFGFGGPGGLGGDTETWEYSYTGVDGAPDVNITVTYQGGQPIDSQVTRSFGESSASSVTPITQEFIGLPSSASGLGDLTADLPSPPAWTPDPGTADSGGGTASFTSTAWAGAGGTAGGMATNSTTAGAGTAAPAGVGDAAPASASIYPDRYLSVSGAGSKAPAGGYDALRLARDLPLLPDEYTPRVAGGNAGTGLPHRDEAGDVFYRTFDAKGVEVGWVSAPTEAVQQLQAVTITGRRDPNGVFEGDGVEEPPPAFTVPSGLPGLARLAPVARAVIAAEIAYGPPQLKAVATASLGIAAALAARQAGQGGLQRDMLTPEEQAEAGRPMINVPAPPTPPLEGLVPPPVDEVHVLPGAPADQPQLPTIETFPIEHQDPWAGIFTKDGNADNNRDRARVGHALNPALADPSALEGQSAVPGVPAEQAGLWAYPPQPRGGKDPNERSKGQDFQEAGTGVPAGLEINLGGTARTTPNGTPTADGGVWLDGVRPQADGEVVYIDRKEWNSWPPLNRPDLAADGIREEAQRQLAYLPEGARLEWQFSNASNAERTAEMLTAEQRRRIIITVVGGP